MPVTPTYPGVYIEEVPSGVRTITGVATSITAFIGRTLRGPVNEPTTINNFGDFERKFGGLWIESPLSYAVRDFFANGGSQALIVRLYQLPDNDTNGSTNGNNGNAEGNDSNGTNGEGEGNGESNDNGSSTKVDKAELEVKNLKLRAAHEGEWGNKLRARIDHYVSDEMMWVAANNLTKTDLFNLTIHDITTNTTETFSNVTVKESPRRVDRVLKNNSVLVRFLEKQKLPSDRPTAHEDPTPAEVKDLWKKSKFSSDVKNPASKSAPLNLKAYEGSRKEKTGLYALEKADLFNILCIPPDTRTSSTSQDVYSKALAYCVERRAMLIVDPPANWNETEKAMKGIRGEGPSEDQITLSGTEARNAALYFPRIIQADPLREGQLDTFVPCGLIAGAMARTDVQRGVWKAPAGINVSLNGTRGLSVYLTDDENGQLNPLGINCLRSFPIIGNVMWGSRTLRGADLLADEYKYVPVRRLALYIEESLYRGTQWVVFEPNDEPLWAQIRLNIGAFMHNLFRQGAFQGSSPKEAYLVKCDSETTTQNDINLGIVNIVVGFAPLKPAEFVIIKIQQLAGQIEA